MGMFGGVKQNQSVSQSEAVGSEITGEDWVVRKKGGGVDFFPLAVIASGLYFWYAWRKMKRQK